MPLKMSHCKKNVNICTHWNKWSDNSSCTVYILSCKCRNGGSY